MKHMISISTKTGDQGETGLANGQRLSKDQLVFEVVGTLDELNSWLGLVVVKLNGINDRQRAFLLTVQDTLFILGAEVAQSPKVKLTQAKLDELERHSEALQQSMAEDWHTRFLLPGGTEIGAWLDIARTVCRRCERVAVGYSHEQPVAPLVLQYLNRLSDYLYVLRCVVNHAVAYPEQQFNAPINNDHTRSK